MHEFFKKYSLTSVVLGKGAYGEVRLAQDRYGKEYAVKIMDKEKLARHEDKIEELYNEVMILRSLDHRNIVKFYDCYEDKKVVKMVMGTSKRGDLFDYVKKTESLTEKDCKRIAKRLTEALKYCYDEGVIHRDLKLENILLGDGNTFDDLALIDFGFAKQLEKGSADKLNTLKTKCGTMSFVAPEVLKQKSYDYKCDIWSLGVVMYVCLSGGYHPFMDEDNAKVRQNVLRGKWKFGPDDVWAGVPATAKDFITNCINPDPTKRYTYEQLLEHEWIADIMDDDKPRASRECLQAPPLLAGPVGFTFNKGAAGISNL